MCPSVIVIYFTSDLPQVTTISAVAVYFIAKYHQILKVYGKYEKQQKPQNHEVTI